VATHLEVKNEWSYSSAPRLPSWHGQENSEEGCLLLLVIGKVKVKFTLEEATKAQRWSRGIGLLFLYPWCSMGWVVNVTPRPLYHRKSPGTICIGAGVIPRTGLEGRGKYRPPTTGIRSTDCPAVPTELSRPIYVGGVAT
jgi:hypothetical protein